MAQIDNLTLKVHENGVFLVFTAQHGATAEVGIDRLADREAGEVREVLLAWCHDRRIDPKPQASEQRHRLLAQDYTD
jgi:hypothetical protein